MNKILVSIFITLMGVNIYIATSALVPKTVLAQSSQTKSPIQENAKTVPIAIYKFRVSIPPRTVIGEERHPVLFFTTVGRRWHTEDLSNSQRFIDRIYQALKKAGYTPAKEISSQQETSPGSMFSDINDVPTPTKKSPSRERFLIGANITKVWMTASRAGTDPGASDVDMKVTWEVYDTLQNKVILTQETYAVDRGGGITEEYFYTVMEMSAAKFFRSSEFNEAIKLSLRNFPAPVPIKPKDASKI
jgi:hypothetical protein